MMVILLPLSCLSQTKETFSVYFGFDKYHLGQGALLQLDSFLNSHPGKIRSLQFELKGYCDNRGSDKYNDALSDKRVAAVKDYLLKQGANIEFILSALGFGKHSPINENRTEAERQLNRRVDIVVIKPEEPAPPEKKEPGKKEKVSLQKQIADTNTTVGTNIVLRNINFFGGSHQFLSESAARLQELLDAMKTYPNLVIRVEGHVCCEAGPGDGIDFETGIKNLSEARAKAVRDYLLANGIAADRVSYKGFGHSSPIYPYPETSEEEMIQNRRVEIKILRK